MEDFKFSTLEYKRPDFEKTGAFAEEMTQKIKNAALESIKQVRINLEDKSDSEKELVVAFARSFEKMTEEDKERLLELLRKE